jgi:hypothetical protein
LSPLLSTPPAATTEAVWNTGGHNGNWHRQECQCYRHQSTAVRPQHNNG